MKMAHKQTNRVKDTWQMLFGIEFDCLFVVCFVLFVCFFVFFFFLPSDSSVCSDIRGLRKHHPFSYVVQLTWLIDLWLIHSAAWHVSCPFTLSWFSRWNWVSCVYIEIISYARRFFSNWRGTAWCMYIREQTKRPNPGLCRLFFTCNACMPGRHARTCPCKNREKNKKNSADR